MAILTHGMRDRVRDIKGDDYPFQVLRRDIYAPGAHLFIQGYFDGDELGCQSGELFRAAWCAWCRGREGGGVTVEISLISPEHSRFLG